MAGGVLRDPESKGLEDVPVHGGKLRLMAVTQGWTSAFSFTPHRGLLIRPLHPAYGWQPPWAWQRSPQGSPQLAPGVAHEPRQSNWPQR